MDFSILEIISGGGPTALIAVLGLAFLYLRNSVIALYARVDALVSCQSQYQINHQYNHVDKNDIEEIKRMILTTSERMDLLAMRLFDKCDAQQQRCGHDCLAARTDQQLRTVR